jgi:hypothetical protein
MISRPSSTASAAGVYPFIAATLLTTVKIVWPEVHAKIPPNYELHLVAAIAFFGAWFQKERTYDMQPKIKG